MNVTTVTPTPRHGVDRFLVGIVAGVILVLVAAGVSLVLLRQPVTQLPADSPAGTVQQFYTAFTAGNAEEAYALLSANMRAKPTKSAFTSYVMRGGRPYYDSDNTTVSLGEEKILGDDAVVSLRVTHFYSGGPFGGSNRDISTETFELKRESAGWRITVLPYRYTP